MQSTAKTVSKEKHEKQQPGCMHQHMRVACASRAPCRTFTHPHPQSMSASAPKPTAQPVFVIAMAEHIATKGGGLWFCLSTRIQQSKPHDPPVDPTGTMFHYENTSHFCVHKVLKCQIGCWRMMRCLACWNTASMDVGRHRNTLLNPPPTPPPPIEIHVFLLFSRPLDPKYPMPISSRHCSKGTPTH